MPFKINSTELSEYNAVEWINHDAFEWAPGDTNRTFRIKKRQKDNRDYTKKLYFKIIN